MSLAAGFPLGVWLLLLVLVQKTCNPGGYLCLDARSMPSKINEGLSDY